MLGTCNRCVRLKSRVTSSGSTVKSWMIFLVFLWLLIFFLFYFIKFLFIYLLMHLFFTFPPLCMLIFFFFYWPICCLCVCVLLSWHFFFFFFFSSLFILCAVFISLRVGLGLIFRWSEIKISYFGVVYKFFTVGMELVVIKDLFIIFYI